ncbi:hypothetical protein VAEU17_280011 [Vibrio aestuarianus]|nr:hypothetical protein VAEU17_280011 [Vibrio aestuarianus]
MKKETTVNLRSNVKLKQELRMAKEKEQYNVLFQLYPAMVALNQRQIRELFHCICDVEQHRKIF